ncbi:hypothetical protein Slin15195_G057170 [Septoria linicola]|uniref:Uncharacterized protein n=1 Tax=Septoria linicola TaxID=215465 RepID=A0A9Q9EKH6_9PEZI|nr:hypothetical protein Slin14017_G073040 [Septoria linicola]USW52398.1 hypothetical protein Slin15195_G057170 [Septoria linicola]
MDTSRDAAPSNEQRRTGFLDLSPELRNKTYEYGLPRNGLLVTPSNTPSGSGSSYQYDHHEEPSLLRASLQIQAEASPIFYGRNALRNSCSQLYDVANSLSPKKLSMLRCFQITDHVIDLVHEEQ